MAIEAQSSPAATVAGSAPLQSASARDRLAALFPDPSAPAPSWWHQRRKALIAVVVIALIGSGLLAAQAFGADNPSYVTATVATHNVDALLNGVALVEPVSQASVAFPASGTVASVDVEVGDSVTVGQTLASLDPEQLTQALHEKQATLAQAELTLQKALNGEAVSGVGSGSGASSARSATARLRCGRRVELERHHGAAHRDGDPAIEQPADRQGATGRARRAAQGRRRGEHRDAGARLRDVGLRGRGDRHDPAGHADRRAAHRVPDRDEERADGPGRGQRRAAAARRGLERARHAAHAAGHHARPRPRRRRPG